MNLRVGGIGIAALILCLCAGVQTSRAAPGPDKESARLIDLTRTVAEGQWRTEDGRPGKTPAIGQISYANAICAKPNAECVYELDGKFKWLETWVGLDREGKLGAIRFQVFADGELAEVWQKALSNGDIAVGLFNRSDSTQKISAQWKNLGISGPWQVRDLWSQEDLGSFDGSYGRDVASHEVVLLRLSQTGAATARTHK